MAEKGPVIEFRGYARRNRANGKYTIRIPKATVAELPDDLWLLKRVTIKSDDGFKQVLEQSPVTMKSGGKVVSIYPRDIIADYCAMGEITVIMEL